MEMFGRACEISMVQMYERDREREKRVFVCMCQRDELLSVVDLISPATGKGTGKTSLNRQYIDSLMIDCTVRCK